MYIKDYLKENILLTDGAMGTYFEELNFDKGRVCEECNITDPDLIKQIHLRYINSGARLIRTNSFALNRQFAIDRRIDDKLAQESYLRTSVKKSYEIARAAADESENEIYIAADIGPIPKKLFEDESLDKMSEYRFIVDAFLDAGACIFNFETFGSAKEVKELAVYIKEKLPTAFVMLSFATNRMGYTTKGHSLKRLLEEVSQIKEIDSVGCNCLIGASHMYDILKNLEFYDTQSLQVLPNSGYPDIVRGKTVYSDSSEWFAKKLEQIIDLGADIVGGCCGTSPKHIEALAKIIKGKKPVAKALISQKSEEKCVNKTRNNEFLRKLDAGKKVIAVELDPPFDQNAEKVVEGAFKLKKHGADIITIADSPLARARADSVLLASKVASMVDIDVMPHIACRDRNKISMHSVLLGAHINGIRNFMVVTGDPVPTAEREETKAGFDFNSVSFMEYINQINNDMFTDDAFAYGGALNQGRKNVDKNIERMQKKIDAGASWFLTQPIYSDEDIETIKYIKEKTDTKILCGLMPLVSYKNAVFIKNEMPGIDVPDEVVALYNPDMSKQEAQDIAVKITKDIMKKLESIADGYYFMVPFNRVMLICDILDSM